MHEETELKAGRITTEQGIFVNLEYINLMRIKNSSKSFQNEIKNDILFFA